MTAWNTEALLARDEATWDALVSAVGNDRAPSEVFAPRLLDHAPFADWVQFANDRLSASDEFFTVHTPLTKFRVWFGGQALAALPPDDPRGWAIRQELINSVAADDGGLAAARALERDMVAAGAPPEELGDVLLLVVKGAFTSGDYAEALRAADGAWRAFCDAGQEDAANFAERRLAAALLYLGEVDDAFARLENALQRRGPLFGGGGVRVFRRAADPRTAAIDEVRDVAAWADASTPEWVRAVGVLAARWDDPDDARRLGERYQKLLERWVPQAGIEGVQVVAQQAMQRDAPEVAAAALDAFLAVYPDNAWASSARAELGDRESFERLRAQFDTAPETALEAMVELFDSIAARGQIAETDLGFELTDFLVDGFLARGDRRAIEVQRTVWDAKLQAWGECPAAWLEEQNVGNVQGELGEVDDGLRRLESALKKQLAYYQDPSHPDVARTERNIARLRERLS